MTNSQPALSGGCPMLRRSLLTVIIPATILFGASQALAENRLALVIGQSAYRSVPALPKPANDARAVTQTLTAAGSELSSATDLSQPQVRGNVSDVAGKCAPK